MLRPTRQLRYDVWQVVGDRAKDHILADQYGFIRDGNHRFYSDVIYKTGLSVDWITISPIHLLDLDQILRLEKPFDPDKYDDIEIADVMSKPALYYKDNGVIRFRVGEWRVQYAMTQNMTQLRAVEVV